MNNSRGSTLAIAVSMVFLFAALGLGALKFGGAQNLFWFNQEANTKAFWVADAGFENALVALQNGTSTCSSLSINNPVNFGSGSYTYNSATGTIPCTINITGTVGSTVRYLQAGIDNFNSLAHNTAAVYDTESKVDKNTVSAGSGATALPNAYSADTNLDFQVVFGASLASVEALATKTYTNDGVNSWTSSPISGITVFKTRPTDTAVTLTNLTSSAGTIFIVDTTASTSLVTISLASSSHTPAVFNGIIYVIGDLNVGNYVTLNGAVYVQGELIFGNNGGGNAGQIFGNSSDISVAGNLLSNNLFINSWQECKNSTCT